MKHNFYITLILLFTTSFLFAQNEASTKDDYVNPEQEYVVPFDSLSVKDKMHYNFEMGLSISSNGSVGTFYKPSVVYQVSKKFSVSTGFMYQNINANNLPILNDFRYQTFSGNISQYYAFVAGKYQINDRWAAGGSVFYDFTQFNDVNGVNLSTNNSAIDRLGYSGFVQYKSPGGGFTFTGEIRINDNYNSYSRYGGNGLRSSFGTGFGNGFSSSPFAPW